MLSTTVPATLHDVLDCVWLSTALSDVAEDERVIAVEVTDSSKTLAEKVRFNVEIEGSDGRHRTRSYCVKAHLDGSPGADLLSEARFYGQLAPLLDIRMPRSYYAAVDEPAEQAMVIMDDVVSEGGHFLSAHTPYSIDTTRDSLSQLARLHAATWAGIDDPAFQWLTPRIRPMTTYFSRDVLQPLLNDGRGRDIAPELQDADTVLEAVRRTADHAVTCVIHGDTHSGNVYLDRAGRTNWLDWQVVQHGHWATDVSYHLASVLDVEDRRTHESDLLDHYLQELASHGIVGPSFNDAWEDYIRGFAYGYFLWAITRVSSRAVVLIHIPRLAAALTDHKTFQKLGVI